MDTILTNVQRVRNSINFGESHFREFKTALEGKQGNKHPRKPVLICREIGEALVSFANADGGDLFIGVEDNGEITGLMHSDEEIEEMLDAVHTHVLNPEEFPLVKAEVVSVDEKRILMFTVAKSTSRVFQLPDGRCMQRKDKSSMPISFENLLFERTEKRSREYDREFIDGASVADLDFNLLQSVANEYMTGMSPEQYLQQLNLGEYVNNSIKLRRAALLLFAKDIVRWEPRCQIRIVRISGTKLLSGEQYNVISDEYITGNIYMLLHDAWERLRPYLSVKVQFGNDGKFEQNYSYPENACREALINAIAHRDYSTQNPIVISFFDDRLEFESPGELLSSVSLDDLKLHVGIHESRNNYIAKVLRENKIMREMGEGINRIYKLMEEQELAEPDLFSGRNTYKIILHHKSVYSQKEQEWLQMFADYELDADQKRVVITGMDGKELSPKDIYGALRSDDRTRYDKCVTALRVKGILEQIRSNAAATQLAKATNVNKSTIARFRIDIPNDEKNLEYTLTKVFVYNVPDECTEEMLKRELGIFGKIKRISKRKDYAYVEFEKLESALMALIIKNIKINDTMLSIYKFKDNIKW